MERIGTICNLCKTPLSRLWYRCLRCLHIELCINCKDSKRNVGTHYYNHPVQCVISKSEQGLFYKGELRVSSSPSAPYPRGYTCPWCARMGFSIETLYQHFHEHHYGSKVKVNCPVCYAEPGTVTLLIANLIVHMAQHLPQMAGSSAATSSASS